MQEDRQTCGYVCLQKARQRGGEDRQIDRRLTDREKYISKEKYKFTNKQQTGRWSRWKDTHAGGQTNMQTKKGRQMGRHSYTQTDTGRKKDRQTYTLKDSQTERQIEM